MKSSLLALGDNATLKKLKEMWKPHQLFLFTPLKIEPIDFTFPQDGFKAKKIIVVSPNAAEFGLKKIVHALPKNIQIFTLGENTAKKIQTFWKGKIIYPRTFNSESLLDLPELQYISRQAILLFKGRGGRTLMTKTLHKRQAMVYTIDCYQRTPLNLDLTKQLKIWQNNHVKALIATSNESLNAFCQLVPKHWLQTLMLIVTSKRLEISAHCHGFTTVICAKNFTEKDLIHTLRKHCL